MSYIITKKSDSEWLINARLASLDFKTFSPTLSSESPKLANPDTMSPEAGRDILIDESGIEQLSQSISPIIFLEKQEEPQLILLEEQADTSPLSQRSKKQTIRSQLILPSTKKEYAREDLKEKLSVQVNNPNHIINGLLKVFHKKFDEVFMGCIYSKNNIEWTLDDEEIYARIIKLIKRTIEVARRFIEWVYEELIIKFKDIVNDQDLNPSFIVESVLYQLLFDDRNSNMNKLLGDLLTRKYASKIQRLEQKIIETDSKELKHYDESLQKAPLFLLEKDPQPYKRVIDFLQNIKAHRSPYDNCEYILALDREILKCVLEYHTNTQDTKEGVLEEFGMDIKTPLVLYCILKSRNLELIISKAFIEEFVDCKNLGGRQDFVAFLSYIDFLSDRNTQGISRSVLSELRSNSIRSC